MIALEPVVQSVRRVESQNLVSIVLFGSQARGDATPESDVDLLVVVERADPGFDRAAHLRWGLIEDRVYVPASFVVLDRAEVDADVPALFLDVATDGQVLFDRDFMAGRIERLRSLIDEAGLYRVRIGPGHFAWQWRRQPAAHWTLDWKGFREHAA